MENGVLSILCPHSSKAYEISSDLWDHHKEHWPSKGSIIIAVSNEWRVLNLPGTSPLSLYSEGRVEEL